MSTTFSRRHARHWLSRPGFPNQRLFLSPLRRRRRIPWVLSRGAVTDLPVGDGWSLSVQWNAQGSSGPVVDVVAFVVDADEQVGDDRDFCFYNNPAHPSGAVELALETPGEVILQSRLDLLPKDERGSSWRRHSRETSPSAIWGPSNSCSAPQTEHPSSVRPWMPRPTRPPSS